MLGYILVAVACLAIGVLCGGFVIHAITTAKAATEAGFVSLRSDLHTVITGIYTDFAALEQRLTTSAHVLTEPAPPTADPAPPATAAEVAPPTPIEEPAPVAEEPAPPTVPTCQACGQILPEAAPTPAATA